MFFETFSAWHLLVTLLVPLVGFAITAAVAYLVIRLAVTQGILAADRWRRQEGDADVA